MAERFSEIAPYADPVFYEAWHDSMHRWGRILGYQVEGDANVPDEGRGMVIFNHIGGLDTVLGAAAIQKRPVVVIGRRKYTHMPIVGNFFRKLGAQTIDRPKDAKNPREAAREAIRIMREPLERDLLELIYG